MNLVDLPHAEKALQGVKAELNDCAFPLLEDIEVISDPSVGFKEKIMIMSFMIRANSRGKGMERAEY